jgi:hypothetical protein
MNKLVNAVVPKHLHSVTQKLNSRIEKCTEGFKARTSSAYECQPPFYDCACRDS